MGYYAPSTTQKKAQTKQPGATSQRVSEAIVGPLFEPLRANVGSSSAAVRYASLELLVRAPRFAPNGDCDVFRLCLAAERVAPTLEDIRVREIALRKLAAPAWVARLPADLIDVPVRCVFFFLPHIIVTPA